MIVVCPKCRSSNKLPDSLNIGKRYFCEKCKAELPVANKSVNYIVVKRDVSKPTAGESKVAVTTFIRRILENVAIHPIFLAISPILWLYSSNVAQVSPSEIKLPLAVSLGCASFIILLSWIICKDVKRMGLILSVFLVLFFNFGTFSAILGGWAEPITLRPLIRLILAIIVFTLFIVFTFFIARTRIDLHKPTIILNFVSAFLLLWPAVHVGVHETRVAQKDLQISSTMGLNILSVPRDDIMPDIYYIILDRYASESTLKEVFDFDNTEFITYLYKKGFYIASESRCNYVKTDESLASSLNMEYLDVLSNKLGKEFNDLGPIYRKIQDNNVCRFLKARGYEFINIGNLWGPTMENKYADKNLNYTRMPDFSRLLFENTLAYPFCIKTNVSQDRRTTHRNCILYAFNKLAEIPNEDAPTFTFAHILATHLPYVFNTDGSYPTASEAKVRTEQIKYIDQLLFINKEVERLIDEILSKSVIPPIVILQADEGPFPTDTELPDFKWQDASQTQLQEKMRIFNAYYLPNIDNTYLYPSITPVNSFRLIFNLYFGTDLELLPDKSYVYTETKPYDYFDVTDQVSYQSEGSTIQSNNK